MWDFINNVLLSFRKCFSRAASFNWFCIVVTAFIVRFDKLGVTSFIRSLSMDGSFYECLLHFFRSSSWNLSSLRKCWYDIIADQAVLYHLNNRPVFVCDGVKCSKEGRYMPGVKKHAQESQTQSKPDMIHGHLWGNLSVLIGTEDKLACLPLSTRIHDGLQAMASWEGADVSAESHIVQMMRNTCEAVSSFGHDVYLLADRYFLTTTALTVLNAFNAISEYRIDLITKAKKNITAYEEPVNIKRRGRPRLKGESVKLSGLFESRKDQFSSITVHMYGKLTEVKYYMTDLLWGQGLYQKLRFVLVLYNGIPGILVSTDLNLNPEDIVAAYAKRFRCEHLYRSLKQVLHAFDYHFWTKSLPKLNHFKKKSDPDPLESVTDPKARRKIIDAFRATEMYMFASNVAIGLIMMISVLFDIDPSELRWQRTPAKEKPSEENMVLLLRNRLFMCLLNSSSNHITDLIRSMSDSKYSFGSDNSV